MLVLILTLSAGISKPCESHPGWDSVNVSEDATHSLQEDVLAQCAQLEAQQLECLPIFKQLVPPLESAKTTAAAAIAGTDTLHRQADGLLNEAAALAATMRTAAQAHDRWLVEHPAAMESLRPQLGGAGDLAGHAVIMTTLERWQSFDETAGWRQERHWREQIGQLTQKLGAWQRAGQIFHDTQLLSLEQLGQVIRNERCVRSALHRFAKQDRTPGQAAFREVFDKKYAELTQALGQLQTSLQALRQMRLSEVEITARDVATVRRAANAELARSNTRLAVAEAAQTAATLRWTARLQAFHQEVFVGKERALQLVSRRHAPRTALRTLEPLIERARGYADALAATNLTYLTRQFEALHQSIHALRRSLRADAEARLAYHTERRIDILMGLAPAKEADSTCQPLLGAAIDAIDDETPYLRLIDACGDR